MTRYEHKIVPARAFEAANPPYGNYGWRVVGVIQSESGPRLVLERKR